MSIPSEYSTDSKLIFDDAYYGAVESDLKRKSGYSNYIEYITSDFYNRTVIKPFFKKFDFAGKTVLELGAGIGVLGKASKRGNTWLCLDASQYCYDNRVHNTFKMNDALEFLTTEGDNTYDYIISFGFLESIDDTKLLDLIKQMNRVAKKQIHGVYNEGNPEYYNIKTTEKWQALFGDTVTVIQYNG